MIPVVVAAALKEAWDAHHHGDADSRDAYATCLGGLGGVAAITICLRF